MWDVWRDWCHFTALALRNSMDRVGWQEREDQYLAIVARYERADIDRFVEAFTVLVAELEAEPRDVLGETYMLLEIASKDMGQFYTPWHLCRLMAEMTFEGIVALCATFKGRAPGRHGRQSVTSCWAEIHIRGVKLLPVSEIPPELLELIRDNMPLLPERDGRMTRTTRVTHP